MGAQRDDSPPDPGLLPQVLPCGCNWTPTRDDRRGPIFWNPYNVVVQCHMCGTCYYGVRA